MIKFDLANPSYEPQRLFSNKDADSSAASGSASGSKPSSARSTSLHKSSESAELEQTKQNIINLAKKAATGDQIDKRLWQNEWRAVYENKDLGLFDELLASTFKTLMSYYNDPQGKDEKFNSYPIKLMPNYLSFNDRPNQKNGYKSTEVDFWKNFDINHQSIIEKSTILKKYSKVLSDELKTLPKLPKVRKYGDEDQSDDYKRDALFVVATDVERFPELTGKETNKLIFDLFFDREHEIISVF